MSTEQSADNPRKTLILIHGRGWKPQSDALQDLWLQALTRGVDRDFAGEGLLQKVSVRFVYYGDLSNALLEETQEPRDTDLDLEDRRNALHELKALKGKKQFRRAGYEALRGKNALKEFLADLGAPLLASLNLTDKVLRRSMPEVVAYLRRDRDFGDMVRERLRGVLEECLERGDDVMLIAHCLGSVVAYDVLWQLSHGTATSPDVPPKLHPPRVKTLVTLGSPLADEFVKRHLLGADRSAEQRHPKNLINWFNVAAEDDFTCHDETVANDFKAMLKRPVLSQLRDFRMYNLAMRFGRSNPHHSAGYLIHPRVAQLLADWIKSD